MTNPRHTSDCRELRFLTFRLGLKGTGRDKKLETIFRFRMPAFSPAHGGAHDMSAEAKDVERKSARSVAGHTARTQGAYLE